MSNTHPEGLVSVSVIAGPLAATKQPLDPAIGKCFRMGDNFYFHITPETAAQWASELELITKENN